ncbi:hypothetical protein AAMO2058_000501300 [Amorphochlora amoebiformis]
MGCSSSIPAPAASQITVKTLEASAQTGDFLIHETNMSTTLGQARLGQLLVKLGAGAKSLGSYWQLRHVASQAVHCGLILRDPPEELLKAAKVTKRAKSGVYVVNTNPGFGTTISSLSETLGFWSTSYTPKNCALIYRASEPGLQRAAPNMDKFWEFIRAALPVKYEVGLMEAFEITFERWVLEGVREQKRDLDKLFCSEFMAEALQRAGVLTGIPVSNSYHPVDFLPGGKMEKNIKSRGSETESPWAMKAPQHIVGFVYGKKEGFKSTHAVK